MANTVSLDSFTTFGALLKYLRQRQRLTQRELGLAVGYGDAQINRLERNLRLPDLGVVVAQFIVALHLEDEPLVAARLVELAAQARGEPVPAAITFTSTSSAQKQHQFVEEIHIGVAGKRRSNLPSPLTNLIGRKREVEEVQQLLRENRLVTLIGAGGVGKTRLSQAAAAELLDTYADGVWWVELAALTDPAFVPDIIASTLKLTDQPGRAPLESIADYFEAKHVLLILDNCEHLIAACADVAAHLLRQSPGLHILATSRETLRVPGEAVYRVPSLTTPQTLNDASNLSDYESVRLFIERAHVAQPKFGLTASNAAAVVQVCQRLDGIPLALELAAAQVKVLSVEQIAARLDQGFGLLAAGARTALPRQQTLKATMDWSYALLSESERALFQSLSVFAGSFSLEAAQAIGCVLDEAHEARGEQVLTLLTQLIDKSLVLAMHGDKQVRYRLLEPIRQYAYEQLAAVGELDAISERHLDYFVNLTEALEPKPHLETSASKKSFDQFEQEYDNLRSALNFAIAHRKNDAALRLSSALGPFWQIHGHWSEGRGWLERVLEVADDFDTSPIRCRRYATTIFQAGVLAWRQGDNLVAERYMKQAHEIYCGLGDRLSIIIVLARLGGITFEQGDYPAAQTTYQECLRLSRELGDRRAIADTLFTVSLVSFNLGDSDEAHRLCDESVALHRAEGDQYGLTYALNLLGRILAAQGDQEAARRLYEECLSLRRSLGDTRGIAATLADVAALHAKYNELDTAQLLYLESLNLFRDLGYELGMAKSLSGVARLLLSREQLLAVRILAAVKSALAKLNASLDEPAKSELEHAIATLRASLDEASFRHAWLEGYTMKLHQAAEVLMGN